jgi:uncharacterized surface protein with fasciclin (FAS1) repeats
MQTIKRTTFSVAGVAAAALLSLTACGGSASTSSSSAPAAAPSASVGSDGPVPVGQLLRCHHGSRREPGRPRLRRLRRAGPHGRRFRGRHGLDPVAVAASNNPILTTLTAAVSGKLNPKVDLVDTLNGGEFTVFAPVDDAFAKIDPATIETLKTDDALLSKILTYHVVPGQITPDEIVGTHATVQGGSVTVTGSGDALKVDDANVICGGVQTKNATVYLIDSVLMPK